MKFSTSLVKFGSVGDLALELKKALTAIATGWNVEHNPDGTHKHTMTVGLHADTHANGGTDAVALDASQITTGTLSDARLSGNVVLENQINTFTQTQEFQQEVSFRGVAPLFNFVETDQGANLKNWQFFVQSQFFGLVAASDVWGALAQPLTCDRSGNVRVGAAVYERGRGPAMGEWADVPFNAANFTGVGGTWTVTSAVYAYILIGKTVIFSLTIPGTSTITGAPTALNVVYPAGLAPPTRSVGTTFQYVMGGTTLGAGLCQMHTAFPTVLYITRDAASTAFAAGTCSIYLQGHYSIA